MRYLLSRTWQAGKLARAGKLSALGWVELTKVSAVLTSNNYNLACYHAWRQDRSSLLAAMRRARTHGKPASQFRADPDFGPWLSDAEFVEVLDEPDPGR